MPEMSGLEAAAAIRAVSSRKTSALARRSTSHHRCYGELHEGRSRTMSCAGMDGYIAKPVHPAELFETVETCL